MFICRADPLWSSDASNGIRSFQEYFFAPRRLIFLNGQVVFKCCRDTPCREDILSENQVFGMEDYVYKLPHGRFSEACNVHQWRLSPWLFLANVLESCSRRRLTFQSDVYDTFAGVSNMLHNECGVDMHFGLPDTSFPAGLLWKPCAPLERRAGFPSWSWMGWIGAISFPESFSGGITPGAVSKRSRVRWYLVNEDQSRPLLLHTFGEMSSVPSRVGDPEQELRRRPRDSSMAEPPGQDGKGGHVSKAPVTPSDICDLIRGLRLPSRLKKHTPAGDSSGSSGSRVQASQRSCRPSPSRAGPRWSWSGDFAKPTPPAAKQESRKPK